MVPQLHTDTTTFRTDGRQPFRPNPGELLVPRENAARQAVRDFLAAQGLADPEDRTVTLLTCVDGLVFDRLVGGGSVSDEEIRRLVTAALR